MTHRGPPTVENPRLPLTDSARGERRRYSRGALVREEPGPGEGGQQPQVVGFVILDELALHLFRRAHDLRLPLERHLAPTGFTEDLGPPDVGLLVALKDDRGCPVAVCCGQRAGKPSDHTRPRLAPAPAPLTGTRRPALAAPHPPRPDLVLLPAQTS